MVKRMALVLGLTAHVDTQAAHDFLVGGRDDHAKERIAAAQLFKAGKDARRNLALRLSDGEGHEGLIGM